ncbi:dTDP-4-amino-4,6-dideoxygalactose transaminase [Acetoanaerobium noterae]|jgi:dTDP-4-amino-4,6-dideoxygalactose transaminase|uniref:dTDP-4-amino-4,6-dideoxygalactose transaminase n=1 Tax=Acetoanaerobium noterae TaxID=745369 RepID=A0A1T4ZQ29_9FIRM|nr:dTDP-4-amino-4,6-dideoxygalactose transaminase [Acetoanaerobium noterae]MBP8762456.1 dTDP-4-amino-4,6-dideoxygalactose transaminase [Acetoanaerobium sp.]MBP9499763.1 dTDP-4-amino-4,6-dideoxygalactose transaminase [Acetoanaerobium sp.]MBP9562060.1 dTDP-4-amino-4,6-dideoxygalactose transaminase [Acetoanaerobium sp.]SKB24894.1 dTDP-4-amino-4,6-dideoxygalactose transaminase [Acetoanaerobium noterae]
MEIPFHKEYHFEQELEYVKDAFDIGVTASDGKYTSKAKALLKDKFGFQEVYMTTSATHALEMAALILDFKQGDEVILASFNFPSAANCIVLRGATPVFVDLDPKTMNISPEEIEKNISSKTKAIIVMHYAGIACDMDKIMEISKKYKLPVIEDAAQALGSKFYDKNLGSMGDMACISFHSTKNFIAGEAGCLIINRKDKEWLKKAEIIRQKGTNRQDLINGKVSKYEWVDQGSSYCPSEILMAVLCSQLENFDRINSKRKKLASIYLERLSKKKYKNYFRPMILPEYANSNNHIFYIITKNKIIRDELQTFLKKHNIGSAFHFIPLHNSIMGKKYGFESNELKYTDNLSQRLLRLPLYNAISEKEINYVCDYIDNFVGEQIL